MTPSPRAARSLDDALGLALEDLEAGLTPIQVLDRYPEYEAELAPLIETAYRLRTSRWPVLSMAARVSGREKMHAALAEQRQRRRVLIPPVWRQVGAGLALALLAGTTYFASPISPLRPTNRPALTVTIPVAASATWTVQALPTYVPPSPAVAVATALPTATRRTRMTAEPEETVDQTIVRTAATPTASVTGRPSATRTRAVPTVVPTATPTLVVTPTATAAATAVGPAATSGPAPATPGAPVVVPSATAIPATATATRTRPTATPTTKPTSVSEPTDTPTVQPPTKPAPTHTPRPTVTSTPEPPKPTETEAPPATRTRRPTRTPEPTGTPEPTKSPEPTDDHPAGEIRRFIEAVRSGSGESVQELRNALQDLRGTQRPNVRKRRP